MANSMVLDAIVKAVWTRQRGGVFSRDPPSSLPTKCPRVESVPTVCPLDSVEEMTTDEVTTALAAEKFVSMTTFKRSGEAVATTLWIAHNEDYLFVWTPAESWKVKRVRNNPRVTLTPCGRFGKLRKGASPVDGIADVITDPATVHRCAGVIARKYGLQYRLVTLVERLAARGAKPRVILRITLSR